MCEMLGLIKYDPYRSTPVSLCTSVCLSVCIVPSAAVGAEAAIPLLAYRRARSVEVPLLVVVVVVLVVVVVVMVAMIVVVVVL